MGRVVLLAEWPLCKEGVRRVVSNYGTCGKTQGMRLRNALARERGDTWPGTRGAFHGESSRTRGRSPPGGKASEGISGRESHGAKRNMGCVQERPVV